MFLVSTAFALTVPVRATLHEVVEPGERPSASTAASATVTLSHPTRGAVYKLTEDELTASLRQAGGRGTLTFTADPSDTIRTWAIYPLDADGRVLADPSIIEISFDQACNGSRAARKGFTDPLSITVTCEEGAIAQGLRAQVSVTVQDSTIAASYLGIDELKAPDGGGTLADAPDLSVMDAAVYGTYQGLGLEGIVPLTDFRVRLDGDLAVEGLATARDGTVESGEELAWDVRFYGDTVCTGKACTAPTLDTVNYDEAIGDVRKRSTTTQRVTLDERDIDIDLWGGSENLTFEGDIRGVAIAAAADVWDGDVRVASSEVVSLDPSSLTVATKPIAGKRADKEKGSAYRTIEVLDSAGRLVVTHTCLMAPTAATLDGRASTWLGTCTTEEGSEVRRIRETDTATGTTFRIEMGGSLFTAESVIKTCTKGDLCNTGTVTVTGGSILTYDEAGELLASGPMTVEETIYDLGFTWKQDITGLTASLYLDVDAPDSPKMQWTAKEDTLVGSLDGVELVSVTLTEAEATDRCSLGSFDYALVAGAARFDYRGPGTHKCTCKPGYR